MKLEDHPTVKRHGNMGAGSDRNSVATPGLDSTWLRRLALETLHGAHVCGTFKRNPAAKGGASTRIAGNVFFQVANTRAPVPSGFTLLDAADRAGVFIDNACRSGTCGSCRVKLAAGTVRMPVEDALSAEDKADGYILACQAEPSGDVVVDA
ncbi:MAG: 2Fe-2S iron-sulfur cluster binding domain-containing protein [Gammaproteobacteria bacterium]|nr:2Fe-2S iron-sulfur cluster binding domain-containing protein [Gammaproteobacteria bacterium]